MVLEACITINPEYSGCYNCSSRLRQAFLRYNEVTAAKSQRIFASCLPSQCCKASLVVSFAVWIVAGQRKCQGLFPDTSQWLDRSHKIRASFPYFRQSWTKEMLLVSKCSTQLVEADQSITKADTAQRSSMYRNLEISKLVKTGQYSKAVENFKVMQQDKNIDNYTYVSVMKACIALAALEEGRHVHARIIQSGCLPDIVLENCLVDLYAKGGSIEDACRVFNSMLARDVVSWSAMLVAFVKCGQGGKALKLFRQMQRERIKPNFVTFLGAINACASISAIEDGRRLHAQMIYSELKFNLAIESCLIDMYSKCASMEDSCCVFSNMTEHNVVSWSTVITGYARCGQGEKALVLFQQMEREQVEPNSRTFVGALNACASISALKEGRRIHKQVIQKGLESHVIVGSSLVDMYSKCGCMEDAHRVFNSMLTRNVVSWSAMIVGYSKSRQPLKALQLFQQMRHERVEPNRVTFVGMLNACSNGGALEEGRKVHIKVIQSHFKLDVNIGNSLIDMYIKSGCPSDAFRVFENLMTRTVVSWTIMIEGLVKLGEEKMALKLFQRMQKEQVEPNIVTFVAVLNACARVAALDEGRRTHSDIIRSQMDSNVLVRSCLVYMYAKCGSLADACRVFNESPLRDAVVWNAMILGYAIHGLGKDALWLFEQMCRVGMEMDGVTLICVLSACSHAGLLDEAHHWLECMLPIYGVSVKLDHYSCIVDLLGRFGHLNEARDIIMNMPTEPGVSVWRALLGACRIHGNLEMGEDAANHVLGLDPKNESAYVLLSNIYAAGTWDNLLSSAS
ncbi:hypothetical protein O6H91_02G151800 [Diphasiastrum complanatum]|uniref:Uncharacterized protein n=1 Tax=Diphasiastrum complanatum TaxID=34168 RepID=A0ACC2ELW5_DIPCM|nr:hypothetical protein O6H91_02G151800 [Diphasiastrum complanatum]